MIPLLNACLALALGGPVGDPIPPPRERLVGDPIPPPREKEVFRFTVQTNTLTGFENASQLNLGVSGKLFEKSGKRVADDELWVYCVSELDKKNQKLILLVVKPSEISAETLVATLERIKEAAREQKVHLTVTVIAHVPAR
jgi:hypothetical protein